MPEPQDCAQPPPSSAQQPEQARIDEREWPANKKMQEHAKEFGPFAVTSEPQPSG